MIYFLHVPRTAGRTFHSCFLKSGTPPERRCPKAYDHLRIDVNVPDCYLLSSHDDFSVVAMLPQNVSVLTHLRDPVDRFLSAYEFAVEVAARVKKRVKRNTVRKNPNRIATEDVWPWSYLVPFFINDELDKADKKWIIPHPDTGNWIQVQHPDGDEYYYNKIKGQSVWNVTSDERQHLLPPLNPYDNPLVLPLADFVKHPIAKELLHNGQTFQVLGITNYSHWGDAGEMRNCVWEFEGAKSHMLEVAMERIEKFIHVGATDKLTESVEAAGVAMKFSLTGAAFGGAEEDASSVWKKGSKPLVIQEDLPSLARTVREARLNLQTLQKQLYTSHQSGLQQTAEHIALKTRVEAARKELRDAQEKLSAGRAALPKEAGDTSAASEAGSGVATNKVGTSRARILAQDLGAEYQMCAQRAQSKNLERRDTSLSNLEMPDGRTVVFSKEARANIPKSIIDEIRRLNELDTKLHKRGQEILNRNREEWQNQGILEALPPVPPMPKGKTRPFKIPKPLKPKPKAMDVTEPEL